MSYNPIFIKPSSGGLSFYAGNIKNLQLNYQKSWKAFCEGLSDNVNDFEYCLRTDISNFFGDINVDLLISKMQKYSANRYSANEGIFLKSLLLYCGHGNFPTIQNHPTLSFLAVDVYLAEIDKMLHEKLKEIGVLDSFITVRYVDDMCLFFNINEKDDLLNIKQIITRLYSDILRSEYLVLNQTKLKLQKTDQVMKSTACISCNDFSEDDLDTKIRVSEDVVEDFFLKLSEETKSLNYSSENLFAVIDKFFTIRDLPVPALSIFKSCLYRKKELFQSEKVIAAIQRALRSEKTLLCFSTKDLVQCILNTRNENLIKFFLNNLFCSSRDGTWSSLDTIAAIEYLIHRNMKHEDLKGVLKKEEPNIFLFCEKFCLEDFVQKTLANNEKKLVKIFEGDLNSKNQFLSYLRHYQVNNLFESVSYYRAFFDRFSSIAKAHKEGKKVKYVYRKKELLELFKNIPDSKKKITRLEKIRQQNPIIHASSEMLNARIYEEELVDGINIITELISSYLDLEFKEGL